MKNIIFVTILTGSMIMAYAQDPTKLTATEFNPNQTAGRAQFGEFAPKFAGLNDDVLFGQVWSRTNKLPANVKHWHGAAADSWFSHLAFDIEGEDTSNEWLEPLSDEEYIKIK